MLPDSLLEKMCLRPILDSDLVKERPKQLLWDVGRAKMGHHGLKIG